jgi:hypothetical protein
LKLNCGIPLSTAAFKFNLRCYREKFAEYPQLGRFTLRDEGKTVRQPAHFNLNLAVCS